MEDIKLDSITNDFAKEVILSQVELFNQSKKEVLLPNNKYKLGNDVFLKRGTFLHGIINDVDNTFNHIVLNGFVSPDFINIKAKGKYPYTVGFWNIQEDILLKDYIINYSGSTIEYFYKDGKRYTKLIPYNNIDKELNDMQDDNFWMWKAEQTKEIRFMPSLAKGLNQIGFILNMDNKYGSLLTKNDIFNKDLTKDFLSNFVVSEALDSFINDDRNDLFTNREAAIIYGIPSNFIEGILVGNIYEADPDKLNAIKRALPNCYICNLDGKVIVA